MGKNIKISENDMTKLGEEFKACKENMDSINTSLSNMRKSLLSEVYEGCATSKVKSDFDKLDKESKNLSYVYSALNLFMARMTKTFKAADTSSADEAKSNVTEIG